MSCGFMRSVGPTSRTDSHSSRLQRGAIGTGIFLFLVCAAFTFFGQSTVHAAGAVGTTTLAGVNDFFCQPSLVGAVSGNYVTVNGTNYTNVTTLQILVYSAEDATFTLTGDVTAAVSGTVTAGNSTVAQVEIPSGDGNKRIRLAADEQGGPGGCFSHTDIVLDQTPPTIATPLFPENYSEINGPTTISFTWDESVDSGVGMDDYQLFIANQVSFPVSTTYTTTSPTTGVSLENPTYLGGKKYWRIAARDLLSNSSQSNVFEFTYDIPDGGGEAICGNGITEGNEECDDGNNKNNDGCTITCKEESSYCGDGIVNQPSESCDDGNDTNDDYCNNACELQECYQRTEDIGEACSDYEPNIIYLIIDQSTSMGGEKLTKTKQAAISFVDQLTPGTTQNGELTAGSLVGVISFNEQGHAQVSPPTANFGQIKLNISQLSAQGYSNFTDPIDIALEDLEGSFTGTQREFILLADGLPSNPAPGADAQAVDAATRAKQAGVNFFTIGLQTASHTDTLLKTMASSVGQFYHAGSSAELPQIFNQLLGETICDESVPQYVNICPQACNDLTVDWSQPDETTYQIDTLRCSGAGDGIYHIEILDEQGSLVEEFMAHNQNDEQWTFSPNAPFSLPATDYTIRCTVGVATNEACTQQLQPAVCGDGNVDPGEACDDGNQIETDSCTSDCQLPPTTACGNGIKESGEQCDDGNTQNGDGCSSSCQTEIDGYCGDGTIDTGETCDDGNNQPGDGCTPDCQKEIIPTPECGDGLLEYREQCDDGNTESGDGCSANCMNEQVGVCGDGMLNQVEEECDDGNTESGDGCTSNCRAEGTVVIKIKKEDNQTEEEETLTEEDRQGFDTQGDSSDRLPTVDEFGSGQDNQDPERDKEDRFGTPTHPAPDGLGSKEFIQKKMATYGLYIFRVLAYDIETYRVWYNMRLFATPQKLTDSHVVYDFQDTTSTG